MATTLTAFITSCRTLAGDGNVNNLARNENLNDAELGNVIDGTNTTFLVKNVPIATGGIQMIRVDNTPIPLTGNAGNGHPYVTPFEPLGMFTLGIPPQTSVYVSYYYYMFSDTDWTEFITAALQRINLSNGNPATDVPNIVEGLLAAIKIYAMAFFCDRVAMQTGTWYNQHLQERTEDRDEVAKKYTALAEKFFKQGDVARDAFYNDRILVPNLAIVQHQMSPITPSY